jgi:uncharacterized protein YgiM (DUF1202 family)
MKMSLWLILGAGLSTGLQAQQVSNAPPATATAAEEPAAVSPAGTATAATSAPAAKPKKKATSKKASKAPKKAPEKRSAADLKTVPLVPGPATVIASNVNVRGQAKLKSEVVARITKGQQVTVLEEVVLNNSGPDEPSAWARIVLPQGTPVWVNASFVNSTNRTVIPKRLNLRSGPGENYSVVGRMERGETVKELSTKGAWMEIEAPTNVSAFVAAQYLKQEAPAVIASTPPPPAAVTPAAPITPAAPATPPEPAPTPSTVTEPPAVAAAPTATPTPAPAPAVANAPPAEAPAVAPAPAAETTNVVATAEEEQPPKKRIVLREGYVRGTGSIQAPTHFSLVSADASRKMIDYLYSPSIELDLRRYKGLHVIVTGEESLEERWGNTPVLTIQKIQVLED